MAGNRAILMSDIMQIVECSPRQEPKPPGPCAMVVFGASGDLTARLLVPALYNLSRTHLLPEHFSLIGVARSEETAESWRGKLYEKLKTYSRSASEFNGSRVDEAAWSRLAEKMSYVPGDIAKPELYEKLRAALAGAEKTQGTGGNAIFYLAVAEHFFCPVVEQLCKAGLIDQPQDEGGKLRYWRRVVFEKPFGHSLDSARKLNARVLRTLSEDQIFRIDHFLGKETVQNIMALRFANGISSPSGTATASIMSRSRSPKLSGWRAAERSTRRRARSVTWCPTTFSRCSRWWRWSRPAASTPPRYAPRRPKCSPRCARSSRTGWCEPSTALVWWRESK